MDVKPGVAEQLSEPFNPGDDLEQSLRDYIGGRTADGDPRLISLLIFNPLTFTKNRT